MSEIGLQRPGVVAPIGQRKTAGVPEHARVRLESHRSASGALLRDVLVGVVGHQQRGDDADDSAESDVVVGSAIA
jgi:hypothetical protein